MLEITVLVKQRLAEAFFFHGVLGVKIILAYYTIKLRYHYQKKAYIFLIACPCSKCGQLVKQYICVEFLPNQSQVQSNLVQIQPKFKGSLLEAVQVFVVDVDNFTEVYEEVSVYVF